jgi:hypothetical protein
VSMKYKLLARRVLAEYEDLKKQYEDLAGT